MADITYPNLPTSLKVVGNTFYIDTSNNALYQDKGVPYLWHRVARYDELPPIPTTLGTANQLLRVNSGATALEYFTPSSGGSVTSFTFTNGGGFTGTVTNSTSTPTLSLVAVTANTTTTGFLSSTDWNTFNSKGSGTVTTISGVNTNGFTWSIANPSTTPALTLSLQDASGSVSGQVNTTTQTFAGTKTFSDVTVTNTVTNTYNRVNNTMYFDNGSTDYAFGPGTYMHVYQKNNIFTWRTGSNSSMGLGMTNTAARVQTLQDKDGTIALLSDIAALSAKDGVQGNQNASTTINTSNFGQNGNLTICANASTGSITLTLPPAATMLGLTVNVVKIDSTSNAVVVKGNGSELINNANTDTTLNTQYASAVYKSSGTQIYKF